MKICVLGAGAWGTALAIHFSLHRHEVTLWSHQEEKALLLKKQNQNSQYLPNIFFPASLNISAQITKADLFIIATPISALRTTAMLIQKYQFGAIPILAACKGFEPNTGLLPHQVLADVLSQNNQIGVLSGPSFAQELAEQLPCAITLASNNFNWIKNVATELNNATMRLYANNDVIGVSVGGAVKNIMAIATGICDGLHFGMNARAALMTRGLAEISRLALALGAEESTLMGLSGMGDLILTCTGSLSRNRKVGLLLAEDKKLEQILQELGHVAEGVFTIKTANALAIKYNIEMPITQLLYLLIHDKITVIHVAEILMDRSPKDE